LQGRSDHLWQVPRVPPADVGSVLSRNWCRGLERTVPSTYRVLDPIRSRTLLIHIKERDRLQGRLRMPGLTLVPLKLYTKNHRIKVELGLCRGKKAYEKRELLKKRDIEKEIRHHLRQKK
jgi:tmRNA-binding protein